MAYEAYTYNKNNWSDGDLITATLMNKIETGIYKNSLNIGAIYDNTKDAVNNYTTLMENYSSLANNYSTLGNNYNALETTLEKKSNISDIE